MGVDKETRAVLKDLGEETALTQGADDIAEVRAAYIRVFGSWTAATPAPTREDWIDFKTATGDTRALVVEPADEALRKGAVIFIHGGGWSLGNALCYAPLCRFLAAVSGLRVIAPDFPQAPEHPYPAALESLIAFVEAARRKYGDPILLAGDSAGGTLAAVIGAEVSSNTPVRGQALLYPVLDLRPDAKYKSRRRFGAGKHFLTNAGILGAAAAYCGDYGDPTSPKISPILDPAPERLPPTFLLLPEFDPLRDEGERYGAMLRKSGVHVDIFKAERTIHGCASFSGRIRQGFEGLTHAAHFLQKCFDV